MTLSALIFNSVSYRRLGLKIVRMPVLTFDVVLTLTVLAKITSHLVAAYPALSVIQVLDVQSLLSIFVKKIQTAHLIKIVFKPLKVSKIALMFASIIVVKRAHFALDEITHQAVNVYLALLGYLVHLMVLVPQIFVKLTLIVETMKFAQSIEKAFLIVSLLAVVLGVDPIHSVYLKIMKHFANVKKDLMEIQTIFFVDALQKTNVEQIMNAHLMRCVA